MDFGGAVRALKDGQRVTRPGWNGKGMWLPRRHRDQREHRRGHWNPAGNRLQVPALHHDVDRERRLRSLAS